MCLELESHFQLHAHSRRVSSPPRESVEKEKIDLNFLKISNILIALLLNYVYMHDINGNNLKIFNIASKSGIVWRLISESWRLRLKLTNVFLRKFDSLFHSTCAEIYHHRLRIDTFQNPSSVILSHSLNFQKWTNEMKWASCPYLSHSSTARRPRSYLLFCIVLSS